MLNIIDTIKGFAIASIALTATLAALGIMLPVVNDSTCGSALTPHIIKEIVCWIG